MYNYNEKPYHTDNGEYCQLADESRACPRHHVYATKLDTTRLPGRHQTDQSGTTRTYAADGTLLGTVIKCPGSSPQYDMYMAISAKHGYVGFYRTRLDARQAIDTGVRA